MDLINKTALTIIIPAYNEAQSIEGVLRSIIGNCKSLIFEIIVVDDGSIDDTATIAGQLGVRVIKHPQNYGYGAAIKTGVIHATNEVICITDADGTYPNDQIPTLFQLMQEKELDMIIGSRPWNKIPVSRRLTKQIIHKLSEFLLNRKVPDMNSGLRLFKRSRFNEFLELLPDGFSLTSTLTLSMLFYKYSVEFISIDYYERIGVSKIHPIKDTFRFLQLVLRTTLYFYPLKIFLPISLTLMLMGGMLALAQVFIFHNVTTIATIIILSGIQIFAIGVLADFINIRIGKR